MSDTALLKKQTREEELFLDHSKWFSQLCLGRNTFAAHWEECASLIVPEQRNTFFYNSLNTPGEKKTDRQVDASGMIALARFAAICDSLLTPRNMKWHGLAADDDYVMKDRQTQLWFEDTTKKLFKYRYAPLANFSSQNNACFKSLGAFGNAPLFVDKFDDPVIKGLRYKSLPIGQLYLMENHQGLVDGFCRHFRLTARQHKKAWPEKFPENLLPALEGHSETLYNYLHFVYPREDRDPERLDEKGKKYVSLYFCIEGRCLLSEGGYNTFPLACGRYEQTAGEVYGRGPAMQVLPALKTLNAEKRVFLTQGHRAASPTYLTTDDGIIDFTARPGALNKGGMSSDGKPLIGTLPVGDVNITKEMMQDEKSIINDAFLVTLFQILTETPQMTATEVIERVNEKSILIAPTVGAQQTGYLGPLIDRELDLLAEQGLLLPMPPRLREAGGSYQVVYTSPLSKAMRAQEAAGFFRTVEGVRELVNITGDPSLLDTFNFDAATPEIAEINGVKPSWMATPDQIQQKRIGRAQQQRMQQEIQAAPAKAAMMKAAAAQAKAGMLQPGAGQPAPAEG